MNLYALVNVIIVDANVRALGSIVFKLLVLKLPHALEPFFSSKLKKAYEYVHRYVCYVNSVFTFDTTRASNSRYKVLVKDRKIIFLSRTRCIFTSSMMYSSFPFFFLSYSSSY